MSSKDFTTAERIKLNRLRKLAIQSQQNRCWWCNREFLNDRNNKYRLATAEHLVPVSMSNNLKLDPHNIVAACLMCNTTRDTITFKDSKKFKTNQIIKEIKKQLALDITKIIKERTK